MADPQALLDAAGRLFARRGVATVEMKDIATEAGCSRATLYRCFESREALHTAYVHREARAVAVRLGEITTQIADPAQRLLTGMTESLRLVRECPALAAWFTDTALGVRAAADSEVVQSAAAGFLRSLAAPDPEDEARWLIRVLTSLLSCPGRDGDDERDMLARFVVPQLVGPAASLSRTPPGL